MNARLLSVIAAMLVACDDPAAQARMRREAEAAVARALAEARQAAEPVPPRTAPEPAWGAPVATFPDVATWSLWQGQSVDPQAALEVVEGLRVVPMFSEQASGLLASAILEASRVSLARLARSGAAPSKACGAGTPVQVYQWPERSLPTERFLPEETLPPGHVLLGVYRPQAVEPADAIAVHSGSATDVHEVLVHEFAHYWFDRACGARALKETSEDFAQAVQAEATPWRSEEGPPDDLPELAPVPRAPLDGVPLDGVVVSSETVLLQVDGPLRLSPGSRVRVTVEEADGTRCRRRGLFRRWRCE